MKVRSFRSIHRDLEEELTPSSCFPSSPWRSSCSYCTITIGEPSELNSTENLPETPVLLEKKKQRKQRYPTAMVGGRSEVSPQSR